MNILLTGATGFVGHHTAQAFLSAGHHVHAIVRRGADTGRLSCLPGAPAIHFYDGSMADIDRIVTSASPDIIVHVAAMVRAEHRMDEVDALIGANVLLGTQLMESAIHHGVRHVINTGSYWQRYLGEVYSPTSLYAATKQAFEDILVFYRDRGGLRALTLELFDTYGPGDQRNKLFNLLARTGASGDVLDMTEGRQLIDLVHVYDVASAYCVAADLLLSHRPINDACRYSVSSGTPMPLRDVVTLYEQLSGRKIRINWGGKPYRYREIMEPAPGALLPGWRPTIDLPTGIRMLLSEAHRA